MLRISDIAVRAGVSSATVSFVLNDRHAEERISEKTRDKVLEAAEELGYRSNQMARAMRTGNTLMLGMLGGDTGEEPVGKMVAGALQAADERGYTLKILRNSIGGSAQQVIRRCSELRLMGVIALHLPPQTLSELRTEADRYGYPLVLMDARSEVSDMPQVVSDDEAGIEAGVAHLAGLGHSKIAFISGEDLSTLSALRENAFDAAMRHHGLEVPESFVVRGDYHFHEPSVQAAHSLLCLPAEKRPTAIFCSGDLIALATLQVAHERRLSVPRDLSVVGFANFCVSEFSTPQLTTVEQPFAEMGSVAVNLLLEILERKEEARLGHAANDKQKQSGGARSGLRQKAEAAKASPSAEEECGALCQPHSSTRTSRAVYKLPTQLIERASTAPPSHPTPSSSPL